MPWISGGVAVQTMCNWGCINLLYYLWPWRVPWTHRRQCLVWVVDWYLSTSPQLVYVSLQCLLRQFCHWQKKRINVIFAFPFVLSRFALMVLATAVKKKWRQWWWWQASSSSRSDEKNVADKTDRTNSSGSSNKRSGAWAVLHTCFATAYAALPSSCRLSLPLWSNPPSPQLPPSFTLFLPHPPWLDQHQQVHRCRFYSYLVSSQLACPTGWLLRHSFSL